MYRPRTHDEPQSWCVLNGFERDPAHSFKMKDKRLSARETHVGTRIANDQSRAWVCLSSSAPRGDHGGVGRGGAVLRAASRGAPRRHWCRNYFANRCSSAAPCCFWPAPSRQGCGDSDHGEGRRKIRWTGIGRGALIACTRIGLKKDELARDERRGHGEISRNDCRNRKRPSSKLQQAERTKSRK